MRTARCTAEHPRVRAGWAKVMRMPLVPPPHSCTVQNSVLDTSRDCETVTSCRTRVFAWTLHNSGHGSVRPAKHTPCIQGRRTPSPSPHARSAPSPGFRVGTPTSASAAAGFATASPHSPHTVPHFPPAHAALPQRLSVDVAQIADAGARQAQRDQARQIECAFQPEDEVHGSRACLTSAGVTEPPFS